MDNYRSELRDETAENALESCKGFGDTCEYKDRGCDAKVTLWCIPGPESRTLVDVDNITEEQTVREFTIPRQKDESGAYMCGTEPVIFPPPMCKPPYSNLPSMYAIVYYEDFEWSVDKWTCDSVEAVFKLQTIRHQPRATKRV